TFEGESGIRTDSAVTAGGASGDVIIFCDGLDLHAGGFVHDFGFGTGTCGNIIIDASPGTVRLDATGSDQPTALVVETQRPLSQGPGGSGGSVLITARQLEVLNEARISATTVTAEPGGGIDVHVDRLIVDAGGG